MYQSRSFRTVLIALTWSSLFALSSVHAASSATEEKAATVKARPASSPVAPARPVKSSSALPLVTMHKDPNCSCCMPWAKHLESAGFTVKTVTTNEMDAVKKRAGVPAGKTSCHTAMVDGYFIEGHVPVEDIKRLLAEKPDAKGLTVPGMPSGSPGMEVPDGTVERYAVELVLKDGTTRIFAQHGH